MAKILWTICIALVFVLFLVVGRGLSASKNDTGKLVSGAKTTLPDFSYTLSEPPAKKEDFKNPDIYAKSAILIDEKSFKILFSKEPDLKIPIASTTKMMTALVILEEYPDRINDVVTITGSMINVDGSDIQLRPGEKITVENLLKGLLIYSGNDAAYSLASFLGGKDSFVGKMNEKTRYLGLEDTYFKDPAGLDDDGFSTARDLAIIGVYALRNEKFAEIVRTPNITFASVDGIVTHELKNSNRMLRTEEQNYYPFAIGIKTGFTPAAGHCLVSAAEKDGHRLVAVILNTDADTLTASAQESKKLLEWGFNNWTWE